MTSEEQSMVEDYKTIQDINQLTLSEEIEDIRRMFLVMSNDMRVVIIKLGGIYYDISILNLPLDDSQWLFVKQVKDIHVPLAERLGLPKEHASVRYLIKKFGYRDKFLRPFSSRHVFTESDLDIIREMAKDPQNTENYHKLSELYLKIEDYDKVKRRLPWR